jgi:1-acyl-sn-glycerol-3-phosphate acyltransferase
MWPVTVRGREHLDPATTTVMVANHLSLLDILVLFRLFTPFRWVSKAEVFKVPLIGWNMSLNRYIKLKRGDGASVRAMLAESEASLRLGSSLMIFPEGTRSPPGSCAPSRRVPSTWPRHPRADRADRRRGTHDALPKHGFVLQGRHPIRVTVLPPVPAERVAAMDVAALTEHVRSLIAAQLEADPLVARRRGRDDRSNPRAWSRSLPTRPDPARRCVRCADHA